MADADRYSVRVGDVSGQVVVGRGNRVTRVEPGGSAAPPSVAEVAVLREAFARVRDRLGELEDGDRRSAGERLDELEEAVTGPEPKVSVMVYVRDWFAEKLPALAGVVTSLIVNPVAGLLVQQAGAGLAAEYERHFGGDGSSGEPSGG
ncbi:hypothetical protein [Streptomyces sp. NBC_01803]|uniref:hypothetical protein n=1 Tax=Streptomyces sp. NBC_01803 TaxID=2975946 RepID=UPI002DDBBC7D|nr:hypothetical protein [Streptomyces sp. NBC_01803]WSA46547.1 hypothetical protein OIE51_21580 [Streptomyces sp. NBC_01803]